MLVFYAVDFPMSDQARRILLAASCVIGIGAFLKLVSAFLLFFRKLSAFRWQRMATAIDFLIFPVGTLYGALSFGILRYDLPKKISISRRLLIIILFAGMYMEAFGLVIGNPPKTSRSPQKRTMADIRSIGTAVEAYAIDNNYYPDARSIDQLAGILEPSYIKSMPRQDGWGHDLRYMCEDSSKPQSYTICSGGKDGSDCTVLEYSGPTTHFNNDIVFSEGQFIEYPEGTQN